MYSKKDQLAWNKAKKPKRAKSPEDLLQMLCENYLHQNDIPFIRIPDEVYSWIIGNESTPQIVKNAFKEYLDGISDTVILFPNGTYKCVELKTEIGKMRVSQKRFRDKVGHHNYEVKRSHEEFKKLVREHNNDTK